jgi:homogentisate 1,2-dioxygenase
LIKNGEDFIKARQAFLENSDVRLAYTKLQKPMPYYFRNADGDDVFFVHVGEGELETDFGPLTYTSGDYIIIPRGTVYRISPKTPSEFLIIESFSEVQFPDKGMLGQHALFDPAVLKVPEPLTKEKQEAVGLSAKSAQGQYNLKIKRCDEITTVTYPFCPINTIGWKGTLTVWQLNVKDIRPISSDRYHLPPSAHTTMVAQNFVICSFLPRPLENGDPKAIKVPFYHSNIDFDEVLFYHDGDFFSRDGIKPGMITFHPQGIHHGPHPNAEKNAQSKTETQEIAVMVDTYRPLRAMACAQSVEYKNYSMSWAVDQKR